MERLMQYVWEQRLWPQFALRTVDGKRVQIIDPGQLNRDAGPDFFNAKVIIDGEMWAGNIEIHVKASDWFRHHHDRDVNYDSVILHVVDKDDAIVRRQNGEIIPQMRMPCSEDLSIHYGRLTNRADIDLPCRDTIEQMPGLYLTDWLENLAFERLYEKAERISELMDRFSGDWEEACYVTLARGLGFGTNSDQFERLASSLPLQFIGKHSDSPVAIEALLFGQSGLLNSGLQDSYSEHLWKEYDFLKKKFGLRAPENLYWKMSRTRPANFPHRRIAFLAAMLYGGFKMAGKILTLENVNEAIEMFSVKMSPYWESRYTFGAPIGRSLSAISKSSIDILIINLVAPLLMCYGLKTGEKMYQDRAIDILHDIRGEQNRITSLFYQAGIKATDAFISQALIQLRRNYCEKRKCLYCRIGHRKLSNHARRKE